MGPDACGTIGAHFNLTTSDRALRQPAAIDYLYRRNIKNTFYTWDFSEYTTNRLNYKLG